MDVRISDPPAARASRRPWGVIGVFALLLVIGVVLLSGQALAEVVYRLIVDGLLCVLWVVAAFGWGAFVPFHAGATLVSPVRLTPQRCTTANTLTPALSRSTGRGRKRRSSDVVLKEGDTSVAPARVIASIALGLGILSLLVLGAGSLHVLGPIACWIFIAVGAVMAIVRGLVHGPAIGAGASQIPLARWAVIALVPLASITLVSAFVPPGILWGDEPNGYDVMEYHLELPREWFQTQSIAPTENNVFSHFPLLVETQYLLAMEMTGGPWAGMYLAQLMHAAICVLAVLAVYGFVIEENSSAAIPATLAMAAAPWVALVAPVAYDEGGLLLFGTLALGFAMRALRGRATVSALILAGVFAGLACSAKLTGVPMVLILVPAALWLAWLAKRVCHSEQSAESRPPNDQILRSAQDDNAGANFSQMVAGTLVFGVAALAVFSPWLIRDYLATHNPVFPELPRIFGAGYFSPEQVARWEIANHLPGVGHRSVAGRLWEFWGQILADVRYAYVLVPLAIFAGATAIISWRRRRAAAAAVFLVCYLIGLAVFWTFFTHTQSRFFILAIPATALLVGRVREHWARGIAWGLVVVELAVSTVYMAGRFGERVVPWRDAGAIGVTDFRKLLPEDVDKALASGKPVALVGEAKAFLYPVDIRRLHYRTVFDVDVKPGESVIDAWRAGAPANAIAIVNPMELERLAKTYYGIPTLPADFAGPRDRVFVEPPRRD